jgi:hypothetical protein
MPRTHRPLEQTLPAHILAIVDAAARRRAGQEICAPDDLGIRDERYARRPLIGSAGYHQWSPTRGLGRCFRHARDGLVPYWQDEELGLPVAGRACAVRAEVWRLGGASLSAPARTATAPAVARKSAYPSGTPGGDCTTSRTAPASPAAPPHTPSTTTITPAWSAACCASPATNGRAPADAACRTAHTLERRALRATGMIRRPRGCAGYTGSRPCRP